MIDCSDFCFECVNTIRNCNFSELAQQNGSDSASLEIIGDSEGDFRAMGVDPNEYLPAAKLGVTKVNIDTDGRLVWTRVHREYFRDKPGDFDFRPPGKIFMQAYADFIAHKNEKLGSAGQLGL